MHPIETKGQTPETIVLSRDESTFVGSAEYICNVQNSIKIQKHIIFLEHVIRLNVSSANIYTSFFANMEISDI